MKWKEASLGIFIIAVIIIMFAPPPPFLIDFLLMINIGLSFIILLDAIYSKEPLEMSMFPTVLLVTTLFSLSLNITTTRAIIGDGYAGAVIETFGVFVARDNIVLGVIIFAILVIVNFLVITKGSERVAEVTARFTLDAMPGKQMAIDADLNTGLINDQEAKARRKKIADESNFFGAMDGASKFVKGNSIAGILITFINIVAGITVGMLGIGGRERLPIGEAAQMYMLMTIGDGLMSQIPALLISVAMGILVTKAVSDEEISTTFIKQLFNKPIVLYIAGGVMMGMPILTRGLPWYFFMPFGAFLIIAARRTGQKQAIAAITADISDDDISPEGLRRMEDTSSYLDIDPITIYFGYGLIPFVETDQGGDMLDRVTMIKRQIALENGALVPPMRLRDNIMLSPSEYKIHIKGVEVAGGDIMFDHYMAFNPGYVDEEIDGIETLEPSAGIPALWISESQRERAETLGYTVVDPPTIMATHITEVIRSHLHELLTRQSVQTLIDKYKEQNPVLIDELIPKLLTVGDIQKVLANLLKEEISIRDMVTILETLADYAHETRDTDMLTEYVRQALKRPISKKYFDNEVNTVITLDPQLEQQIMSSVQHTQQGSYLALDPKVTQKVFEKLNNEVTKLTSMGLRPIILTTPFVRLYFKRLIEPIAPNLVVLSYNELEPAAEIQSVGMVSIA